MNFSTGQELLELCRTNNASIAEIMLRKETLASGLSEDAIQEKMATSLEIMKRAVDRGLNEDIKSVSGLIGGDAKRIMDRGAGHKSVCGSLMSKAISRAVAVLEVNAAMGKIVAAPTAGSSGIIPGVLITLGEEFDLSDDDLVRGLYVASGVGMIISKNATVAGAEGGCQAETGSAAAMAAAAVVELIGGSPEECLHAAALCIKNILGLVCDPIAGLVESPCNTRNAIGAANALISAEMALAGVKSLIPFDEVVEAMYRVGKALPFELRETALGGLATTPTGVRLKKEIMGE